MCFIKESEKRIAETDIYCYKRVRKTWRDDFAFSDRGFLYERGIMQPIINFAFRKSCLGYLVLIFAGYCSWVAPSFGANAKFVIPAGSAYYHSERFGEYVSNRIMFVDWI